MKSEQVDVAIAIAKSWCSRRAKHTGITLVKEGEVLHWVDGERLPDPSIFGSSTGEPTYAIYDDGIAWEAFGEGLEEGRAEGWRRVFPSTS